MSKYFAESELIINEDGSCFHLHLRPEQVADKVILVGDPGRVALVASHFEEKECEVASREFHAITGTYKGKRITVQSTGIGAGCAEEHRLRYPHRETRAHHPHPRAHRNLRRLAAQLSCRNLRRFTEEHRFRWTHQLLCPPQRNLRPRDRG